MATDYVTLGPTPGDEACAQVGADNYRETMRAESKRYIAGLQRMFPLPEGCNARIAVKGFPHDYGTYHEVCVIFGDDDEVAIQYAYHVENNLPGSWEEMDAAAPMPLTIDAE